MISQREASFRLSTTARPRLTTRLAEGVLVSGFAGTATRLANVTLYDTGDPFWFSPSVRLHLSLLLEHQGFVPMVATVASYVLATGDVTGALLEQQSGEPKTQLVLSSPHGWASAINGCRLPTPPGNRWLWLSATSLPQPSGTR